MEVKGDPEDFVPTYLKLDKKGLVFKDVNKIIKDLKKDKKVGVHLQRNKVPKYYTKKQVGNAWRDDEIYVKIRGELKYLFAMINDET